MNQSRRGISIVEAIAVLAIFVVLTTTAASYFRMTAKVRMAATKQSLALVEAQNTLEIWTRANSTQRIALSGAEAMGGSSETFEIADASQAMQRKFITRIDLRAKMVGKTPVEEITVNVQWVESKSPRSLTLVGWRVMDREAAEDPEKAASSVEDPSEETKNEKR